MSIIEIFILGMGGMAVLIVLALIVMQLNRSSQERTQRQLGGTSGGTGRPIPAARVNMRSNWLEGVEGSVVGKTYHIGSREGTIGRKVGNYIQLIDDNISRVHVKFIGSAQGTSIIDQKSNIGTRVNGQPLTAGVAHMLEQGDRLEIGANTFIFHTQASFPMNHGLTEAKIAGQAQQKTTQAMGAVNWRKDVSDALVKAGGDKQRAAEIMGVPVEVYEKMLEQAQLGGE